MGNYYLVDDDSTNATRPIALEPDSLEPGWTGKANAVWTAAKTAQGEWLLFTDADRRPAPRPA